MPRKMKDFVISSVALIALAAALMAISPRLREIGHELVVHQQWDGPRGVVINSSRYAATAVNGYANDNLYLSAFLAGAGVFVFLMLRIIR